MAENNMFDMSEVTVEKLPDRFSETLSVSENENTDKNIRCFDVSENGMVIICLKDNSVNVYDNTLEFDYSFTFDINGSVKAFWYDGYPAVYLDKCDMIALISPDGEIIHAFLVEQSAENSELYREITQKNEIKQGNYLYKLEHSSWFTRLFCTNYNKIVQTDLTSGTDKTVYKNNDADFSLGISLIAIITFFICVIKFGIINSVLLIE